MYEDKRKFYNNEEKLDFLIEHLKLNANDIAKTFGVQANYISKLRKYSYDFLRPMHLHAFAHAFNVPYKIFENKSINSSEKIKAILKEKEASKQKNIFTQNEQFMENIEGDWYAYFYPSNRFAEIYRIKTTINLDGTISDENGNKGKLFIGTNQSIIIKEAKNSKNLVSITFDNHQVAYEMFHFSLVSKRNHNNLEMFNYGFFSRYEIEAMMLKDILGEKSKVQLKMECDFAERISEYVEIIR